jgi:hypothetical protein
MCGIGLLVYGLLSFQAGSEAPIVPSAFTQVGCEISYGVNARLDATIGAVLLAAGCRGFAKPEMSLSRLATERPCGCVR